MYKRKTKLSVILMIVALLLIGGILLGKTETRTVYASSTPQLTTATQANLEQTMNSDYFIFNGIEYHISQYYELFMQSSTAGRVVQGSNQVGGAQDFKPSIFFLREDPITSLIPIAVFNELTTTGIYTHMGKQWGVIIDVFYDANNIRHFIVQLLDINTSDNVDGNNQANPLNQLGRYSVEVKPLFEVEYVWVNNNSGKVNIAYHTYNANKSTYYGGMGIVATDFTKSSANLYALPQAEYIQDRGVGLATFSFHQNTKRNYINNISFTSLLHNEQDANPGHNGYEPYYQDFGMYFHGNDFHFTACDINNLKQQATKRDASNTIKTIKTIAGFIPWDPLSAVLNISDAIDLIPSPAYPPPLISNNSGGYFNYSSADWDFYMNQYGHLIKDNRVGFDDNDKDKLALIIDAFSQEKSYAKAIFYTAQRSDNQFRVWTSRIETGFSFDVCGYLDKANPKARAKWTQKQVLRNTHENYKEVTVGETTVYNYYHNTSRFKFVAPESGYYRKYFADRAHDSWYKNFNISEIYLNKGQIYNFELEYINTDNNVSVSKLIIEKADLKFSFLPGGTAYSVKGLNNVAEIIIPSHFRGLPVTEIADYGFRDFTQLISVEIPDTITEIGAHAFANCTSLVEVTLPSSITRIRDAWGGGVFIGCTSLISVIFEENSQLIGLPSFIFYGCKSLKNVVMPDSIRWISDNAFGDCRDLTDIIIPAGVEGIGNNAFQGCVNLESLVFEEGSRLVSIGNYAFFCSALASIIIPKNVSGIGDNAFQSCFNLTSIVFEEDSRLVRIADSAFQATGLASIIIPRSVSDIGDYAFNSCSDMASVSFEEGSQLTGIGVGAFFGCGFTNIIIPQGVVKIGDGAFQRCLNLSSVKFKSDNQLDSIGNSAFSDCRRLTNIIIPKSVTDIGAFAFFNCKCIIEIIIPNNVVKIGVSAFEGCTGLKDVYFRQKYENITAIWDMLIIRKSAFKGCSGLTKIELPRQLINLGETVFFDCSNLTTVSINALYLSGTLLVISSDGALFYNCPSMRRIFISSSDATTIYKESIDWRGYKDFISCGQDTTALWRQASDNIYDYQYFGDDYEHFQHTITISQPYLMTLYQEGYGILARGTGTINARIFKTSNYSPIVLTIESVTDNYNLISWVENIEHKLDYVLITDVYDWSYGWYNPYHWFFKEYSPFHVIQNETVCNLLANYQFELVMLNSMFHLWNMGISQFTESILHDYSVDWGGIKGVIFYVQTNEFLNEVNELSESLKNITGMNFEIIIIPCETIEDYEPPENSWLLYGNHDYFKGRDAAEAFMQQYLIEDYKGSAVFLVSNSNIFFRLGIIDGMTHAMFNYEIINVSEEIECTNMLYDLLYNLRYGYYYGEILTEAPLHYIFIDWVVDLDLFMWIYDAIDPAAEVYVIGALFSIFNDEAFLSQISQTIHEGFFHTNFFLANEPLPMNLFITEILLWLQNGYPVEESPYWQYVSVGFYCYELLDWVYYNFEGFFNKSTVVPFDFMTYFSLQ